jgi:hypothetical protein
MAIVQRNGCGTTRSARPDLMCEASVTPTMNATRGQTCAIAADHFRPEESIAKKMTFAV